jgi:hypothetical protein
MNRTEWNKEVEMLSKFDWKADLVNSYNFCAGRASSLMFFGTKGTDNAYISIDTDGTLSVGTIDCAPGYPEDGIFTTTYAQKPHFINGKGEMKEVKNWKETMVMILNGCLLNGLHFHGIYEGIAAIGGLRGTDPEIDDGVYDFISEKLVERAHA